MKHLLIIYITIFPLAQMSSQIGISASPHNPTTYSNNDIELMSIYIEANQKKLLGRYDDAIDLYHVVIERDPLNAAAHHDLARIYQIEENHEAALSSAKKAVRYKPKNQWYQLTLIELHESQHDHKAAATLLRKLIADQGHEDLYMRLADNLTKANHIQEAIEIYDRTDELYGIDEWRADTKVDLYLQLNQEKEALREVEKWTLLYPQKVAYWIKLAQYHEYRGNKNQSQKTYEKVLELEPTHAEALYKTSSTAIYTEQGRIAVIDNPQIDIDDKIATILPLLEDEDQLPELQASARALVDQYPQSAQAHALLGDTYWLQDNARAAAESYKIALQYNKSVFQVWDNYMQALAQLNDQSALLEISVRAIDYYPNQAAPYYYHALANYRLGNLEKVTSDLEEAIFIAGAGDIWDLGQMLMAQLISEKDGLAPAISYLSSIETQHQSPHIYEFWGDLLVKNDKDAKAKSIYQEAIKLGGDSDRIHVKISAL